MFVDDLHNLNVRRRMEDRGEQLTLYHGTTLRAFEDIKKRGILPRSITRSEGNWKHSHADSIPTLVYMTDAYAIYYAMAACNDDDVPVVLRISVDPSKTTLYADEDVILHGLGASTGEWHGVDPTSDEWSHVDYKKSLMFLGTCTAKHIPVSDITGVAIGTQRSWMFLQDPSLSPVHYRILGEVYRQQCASLPYKNIDHE